jgi:hypothetical protein
MKTRSDAVEQSAEQIVNPALSTFLNCAERIVKPLPDLFRRKIFFVRSDSPGLLEWIGV